jgi:Flp pilus assembly protein TadD
MLSLFVTGRDGLLSWASGAPDYSVDRAFAALDPSARPGALDGPAALARLERFREDPVALLADVEADDLASTIIGGQVGRCTSARSAYIRSLTAARSGRFGEASAYIEEARGNCPENGLLTLEASDFYVSASRSFASGRQLAEAIEAARRALELRPENPRGFYNLATLEMKRDPLTAAALLARAADLDPAYLPALLLQAEAEIEAGRLGPASETISRALSLAPFNLRAHHLRGICSLRAGQLAEARADFQRVVASEPQNAAALSALAYTWLLDGDLEKAQRSYEKALAVSPGDLEVLNNLATVLAERKDYGEAARIWEKSMELNPSNQAIRANLEEVRQMMSRPEEGP